jgi:hypothetical protein
LVELSLRGLVEVASDILAGVFTEVSMAYTPATETDWDYYDVYT